MAPRGYDSREHGVGPRGEQGRARGHSGAGRDAPGRDARRQAGPRADGPRADGPRADGPRGGVPGRRDAAGLDECPRLVLSGAAPGSAAVPGATALRLLREGTLDVIGRLADASNATLYCRAVGTDDDGAEAEVACVYKPVRGERPLWDFPIGTLANREYAAYLVSEASGWAIAPPTLLRDGPFGWGMVQLWIDVDDGVDVVALVRRCDDRLRPMALFDAVVNNADRKGGHLLPVPGGHVHGVDHGICFAVEPKLRTILWGWRGTPFRRDERETLERLRACLDGDLGARLRDLLTNREVAFTARRLDALLARGTFPQPDPDRPAIPWPPF